MWCGGKVRDAGADDVTRTYLSCRWWQYMMSEMKGREDVYEGLIQRPIAGVLLSNIRPSVRTVKLVCENEASGPIIGAFCVFHPLSYSRPLSPSL